MEIKATARFVRGSHQKFSRYCKLIVGKKAQEALDILDNMPSPLARVVFKTLQSAVANADHNNSISIEALRVKSAFANQGPAMRRFQPRARGRAFPIRKRLSHVTVVLESEEAEE